LPRLIVRAEGRPDRIVEIEGRLLTIGRSAENHLQIDDLNSSRHHCELHEGEAGWELVDKDSRNGVFVNGRRVSRHPLAPGDKIEVGTTVLHFERVEEAAASGRETIDITTGAYSAVEDPTGVKELMNSVLDTKRLGRGVTSAIRRALADAETDPGGKAAGLEDDWGRDALRRLLELNRALNSELNLRRLLERVLDTAIGLSGAERGFLLLLEPDRPGTFSVKASRNIDQESIRDAREKISTSVLAELVQTGRSVLLGDASADDRFSGKESVLHMKLRSVLVTPLRRGDRLEGALYLDNRFAARRFDPAGQELVELVADSAMVAITNARLFEQNARQREELSFAKEELERLNALLREQVAARDRELDRAREALARGRDELELKYEYAAIVTASPRMLEVLQVLDKVTDSTVPVLIQGESGTGKELFARALHFNGPRKKATFVSENCAAIPANLMESEFFGHVRGAFTGASADKAGLFEVADGGTLFLDEIGDMDLDMQTKLLRVLQDGVLRRVGSKEFRRVDVRIVSATNKDLLALIGEARFREDLYYRLNVINITLPPLRDRPEDIPLLTQHFLARQAADAGHDPCELSPAALDLLLQHPWPGNIRELENELLRASALGGGGGAIEVHHLSRAVTEGGARQGAEPATARRVRGALLEGKTLKELVAAEVEEVERHAIAAILRRTEYTKTKAASILGISRPTLDAKIDKYGLTRDQILGS